MPIPVTIAYTPEYLDWRLGAGHPTNPERARIAVERITTWAAALGVDLRHHVPELNLGRALEEAAKIHDRSYLERFYDGWSGEWSGRSPRLRDVAALMFTGTVDLVEDMLATRGPGIWFNPQGAKHHAHHARSSGFCVLNDMAWAAKRFTAEGKTVLYVDWDAHHGDGVEALLLSEPAAVTCSIHDGTIFPGTGLRSRPSHGAYNWPLAQGAGDEALRTALTEVIGLIESVNPDVLLLACGADGLDGDPLSSLTFSLGGIAEAAGRLGRCTGVRQSPVLIGGAGGYQPLTETPQAWALTVARLYESYVGMVDRTGLLEPVLSRRWPGAAPSMRTWP